MKPLTAGILASAIMSSLVGATLYLAGGPAHIISEMRSLGPLYIALIASFGTQIGILVEHRNRHAMMVSGTGSSAAMIACCAHHISDFAPLMGLAPIFLPIVQFQREILFVSTILSISATAWMIRTYETRPDIFGGIAASRYPLVSLLSIILTFITYGGIMQ